MRQTHNILYTQREETTLTPRFRPISIWTMTDSPESDVSNPVHPRPAMSFPSCKSEVIADGLATVHDDGENQRQSEVFMTIWCGLA